MFHVARSRRHQIRDQVEPFFELRVDARQCVVHQVALHDQRVEDEDRHHHHCQYDNAEYHKSPPCEWPPFRLLELKRLCGA
ncbi:hypothetical protein SDC9_90506 [bioreactor metagenome]|uniref:Uncharacterized protein n=1 Tax=bioreactor metagenome TaxID=1076179 RepID=A0A644ZS55_9ZZZZ